MDVLSLTLPKLLSLTAAGNPFYQDVKIIHVVFLYYVTKRTLKMMDFTGAKFEETDTYCSSIAKFFGPASF